MMARPGLRIHPKFRRLCHLLNVPVPHALGYLECLWMVGYESGVAQIGDPVDIELAAEWPGERGVLFGALRDTGFIDEVAEGVWQIHDFWDHCPEYVAKRAAREVDRQEKGETLASLRSKAGRKGAMRRWGDGKRMANDGNCPPLAIEEWQMDGNCPPLATEEWQTDGKRRPMDGKRMANGDTPSPSPSRGKNSPTTPSCPETEQAPSSGPAEAAVLTFPTDGKVKTWDLLPSKVADLQVAFPALDVVAEARRALAWVQADPGRRKTARGMGRFLFGWLSRSQNAGAGRAVPATSAPPPETDEQRRARILAERERRRIEEEQILATQNGQAKGELL